MRWKKCLEDRDLRKMVKVVRPCIEPDFYRVVALINHTFNAAPLAVAHLYGTTFITTDEEFLLSLRLQTQEPCSFWYVAMAHLSMPTAATGLNSAAMMPKVGLPKPLLTGLS